MTTKDCQFLQSKKVECLFSNTINNQFSNLNLNQSNNCKPIVSGDSGKPFSGNSNKSYGSTNQQNHSLSKNDFLSLKHGGNKHGKTKSTNNLFFGDNDKINDKEKEGTLNKAVSTLSLHIAAYENSIKGEKRSEQDQKIESESSEQKKSGKWWKSVKSTVPKFDVTALFEIPRQQPEGCQKPEVMQFKASQKLLTPNGKTSAEENIISYECVDCGTFYLDKNQFKLHKKKCIAIIPSDDEDSDDAMSGYKHDVAEDETSSIASSTEDLVIVKPQKPSEKESDDSKTEELKASAKVNLKSQKSKTNKRLPYQWDDPKAVALMKPLLKNDKLQRNVLKQLAVDLEKIFNRKVAHSTLSEKISKMKKQFNQETCMKSVKSSNDKNVGFVAPPLKIGNDKNVTQAVKDLMANFNEEQQQLFATFNENLAKVLGSANEGKHAISVNSNNESKGKKRILGNKILVKNFKFGYNERLKKNIVIVETETTASEYRQKDDKNGVKYYNCSRCGSTATLYSDNEFWASPHEHDCNPYPRDFFAACQSELKAKEYAIKGVAPHKAYDFGFLDAVDNKAEDVYKPYWKKKNVLTRANQNQIGLENCTIGKTADSFKTLISSTPNVRWLLSECREYAVFSSDRMLTALAHAVVLSGDATFSIRPDDTSQVLTLFALVDSDTGMEWVGVLMAVMKTKEQKHYEAIMRDILIGWKRLDITPTFGRVHSDYEAGLMNALKLLGGEKRLYGCNFHFCQATYRMIVKLKLYSYYKDGISRDNVYHSIRKWLRDLLCLPFLMKGDIQLYWTHVLRFPPKAVGNAPWPVDEMNQMVEYYEKEWISRQDNSFCFFGLDRVRNTNINENFHNVGKQRFPKRPSYKNFLNAQRLEYSQHEVRLKQLAKGYDSRPQEHKYADLDERLKSCEVDYMEGKEEAKSSGELIRVLAAHLKRVNYVVHDIRNRSTHTVKSEKRTGKKAAAAAKKVIMDRTLDGLGYIEQASIVDRTITGDSDDEEDQQDKDIDEIYKSMVEDDLRLACELSSNASIVLSDDDDDVKPAKIPKLDKHQSLPVKQEKREDDFAGLDHSILGNQKQPERPEYFNAPSLDQLQQALITIGIDPEEAYGSPLLLYHKNDISAKRLNPFAIHKILGDGNCGFRTLSYLLTGTQGYHWQIRIFATNELANNVVWDRIVGRNERQRYVQQARLLQGMAPREFKEAEWYLDNDHLFVLSGFMSMNIYTVSKPKETVIMQAHTPDGYRPNAQWPNIFMNFAHTHYTACVRPL